MAVGIVAPAPPLRHPAWAPVGLATIRTMPLPRFLLFLSVLVGVASCSDAIVPAEPTPALTRTELLDPQTCKACHPAQFRDWSASVHAHAAEDPVFLAMNRRGQRETKGKLGAFCVKCHAPMAVREGLTTDGLNLATVPKALQGVTCFFCHSVAGVEGTHDAALRLADDLVMRGPIADPMKNKAHASAWSALHDRDRLASAQMCGACHDVVSPAGTALERTFIEWQASVFSHAPGGTTCSQCHMPQSTTPLPVANVAGAPLRRTHNHQFAAVDVPAASGPDITAHVQTIQAQLDATLQSAVCVTMSGPPRVEVTLDNIAAGHSFPSGASQDRRLWVEVVAYHGAEILYQTGTALPGDPTAGADPDLWLMRDCLRDAAGKPVHMFWEAASSVGNALPAQATFDKLDPRFYQSHVVARFPQTGALAKPPDRVTVRVRLQAIGRDVLDSLVQSGDLDPAVRDAAPTWQVGQALEWTAQGASLAFTRDGVTRSCLSLTQLDPRADSVPAVRSPCAP